jgi:hypothetical protein
VVGVVAPVAAEEFVAAVAGKADGDVLTCETGDNGGREDGAVEEGFAEVVEDVGEDVEDVGVAAGEFVVLGGEASGDEAGVAGFVEGGLVGPGDGEGLDGLGREFGEMGDDDGGVEAAGEEGAEGDVGDALAGDGVEEGAADAVRGRWRRGAVGGKVGKVRR